MERYDMADRANENAHTPAWVQDLLPLERPLAVFDLETTGTFPQADRIVEIGILKILPDGRTETRTRRVNPEMPIPAAATAVHGIRDADVVGEPFFHQIAPGLLEFLAGCDLAGYNIVRFDLPLLRHEFERAGIEFPVAGRRVIDAMVIFHLMEPRDLAAAHQLYCGTPLGNAHSAEVDARAAYRVLLGELRRYPSLPHSLDDLHRLCNPVETVDIEGKLQWQEDEVVFNFGKHRGKMLRTVLAEDRDYVQFLLGKDFPDDLKRILAAALQGRLPQRVLGAEPQPAIRTGTAIQATLPFPGGGVGTGSGGAVGESGAAGTVRGVGEVGSAGGESGGGSATPGREDSNREGRAP